MYLLDTNIISAFYRGNDHLLEHLQKTPENQIISCSIVFAELYYGLEKLQQSPRKLDLERFMSKFEKKITILNFDLESAKIFAQIKQNLKIAGLTTEDTDLMIASICIANELILVTNNTKHFKNIPDLQIEDWLK